LALLATAESARPVDVVVVARPNDQHGDAVQTELVRRRVPTWRVSLNHFPGVAISWSPAKLCQFGSPNDRVVIGEHTTAWWRRPGWMDPQGLSPAEMELAHNEASNILRGVLTCAVGRWVDPPATVEAAEDKLAQLQLAQRLDVATPPTLVTSDPEAARAFATEGPIVAKAVSSGAGIQPFTGEVRPDLLELVARCPVLLQRRVDACADLRVVTVGSEVFAWSRSRDSEGPLDWRATDPAGSGFRAIPAMPVADSALRLSGALGLTHSTQDWLLTTDGPVFLEVNPQGQWLFLDGAESSVVPALASLLAGR
jgi:hypothetical protein